MGTKAFKVNILGLGLRNHQFEFEIDKTFFEQYNTGFVSEGSFIAHVELDKRETLIEATFSIKGTTKLICDRSLEPFEYPLKINKRIVFKYGEVNEELSDEIIVIQRDTDSLDLGQYIYEFINLEIPMKKLHPKFQEEEDEEDDSEGKIIYTSGSSDNKDDDNEIDPRWEILKKLK
jgi:uncharacterized protein